MSAEAITTTHGSLEGVDGNVAGWEATHVEAERFAESVEKAVEEILDEVVRKPLGKIVEGIERLKVKGMEHEGRRLILRTYSPLRVWYMKRQGWKVRSAYRKPMIQMKGKIIYRRSWILVPAVAR